MSIYDNEQCPVCHKEFSENDDIVTCPYCGTPHHRECYDELSHCFNKELHSQGFSYIREDKAVNEKTTNHIEEKQEPKKLCKNCSKEIGKNDTICEYCGANQPIINIPPFVNPVVNNDPYSKSDIKIDDVEMKDISAVVRTNQKHFIPRFIKNSKINWNWGGFFFGAYYLFFRRMNKYGTILMAIQMIISLVVESVFAKELNIVYEFATKNYPLLQKSQISIDEFYKGFEPAMAPMLIILAVTVLSCVIVAMFSDTLYRKKVVEMVKKVDLKLNNDDIVSQNTLMGLGETMSKKDLRRLFLTQIGGTSFFSPLMAYCVLQLLNYFINML